MSPDLLSYMLILFILALFIIKKTTLNTRGQNFPTTISFPNYIYLVGTFVCLPGDNLLE